MITPAVERLRDELGLPGDARAPVRLRSRATAHSPHRFENHVENRVVYTGTHDHDTARGWYESLDPGVRAAVDAELAAAQRATDAEPWWGLIRLALPRRRGWR